MHQNKKVKHKRQDSGNIGHITEERKEIPKTMLGNGGPQWSAKESLFKTLESNCPD